MKHAISLLLLVTISVNSFSQSWALAGNGGTNPPTSYIGTSDLKDLVFKRNVYKSGFLGENSTSFGYLSLSASNNTGFNNTAIGSYSLQANTSGAFNTAVGYSTLRSDTTGSYNSAFGFSSLFYNTTGIGNTAIGARSLQFNQTGINNTSSGYYSLHSNISGYGNSALGFNSLYYNTSGAYNTAIGQNSLLNNQTGHYNTILGYNTGLGITSGSKNTVIGANVTGLSSALSNSIILADGDGNQRIFVNQDGNVGVGITSLTTGIKLNVNGNIFTNQKILINSDLTHAGNFSLAVNGEAIFNRAVVRLYGSWPDYVFGETYKPESLEEVEKYIKENKHLKGMKSASEIAEDGIDLGENQKKMLEKIEELTLYIIEQNKAINNLQKEVDLLKKNTKQ